MNDESKEQLNERLKELVLLVKQYPQNSTKRRFALTQLINAIWNSGKLAYPTYEKYKSNCQDIYDEAIQDLFFYICKDDNISKYNPERGEVLTWVNVLLNKRFFSEAAPKIMGSELEISLDKSDLEKIASPETESLSEQVMQFIENDPESIFVKEFIRGHPEVNFKEIAKKRYSGMSWKDISAEWGIGISSLHLFFQRAVKKFTPILRDNF